MAKPKMKIKNEEQIRKKKDSNRFKKKKKTLGDLKSNINKFRLLDKETESEWSKVNIDKETELMAMGLVSLEVIEEYEPEQIIRSRKRKKTTAPKNTIASESLDKAVNNTTKSKKADVLPGNDKKADVLPGDDKKHVKKCDTSVESSNDNATGKEDEESEEFKKAVKKRPTAEEIKLKKKLKQKERMAKIRLKRQENPDSESEKRRKEKLKLKRKAKKATKICEKRNKELEKVSNNSIDDSNHVTRNLLNEFNQSDTIEKLNNTSDAVADTTGDSTKISETVKCEDTSASLDVTCDEGVASRDITLTAEERRKGKQWLELDVCEEIVKAVVELGFTTPTPIQQRCIPAGLLKYKDVIGAAQTGSGKTLAFGIPLIQRVMRHRVDGELNGLVLCPTRELALQVTDHLKAAAKYTNLLITAVVGGMAPPKQHRLLSYHPAIIVATPGRFYQLIQESPFLQNLSHLRFLIIDEADRMVEDGHYKEVAHIVGRIPCPKSRNTFLFSATLAFTIDKLDEKLKKTPKKTKQEKKMAKKFGGLEMLVRNVGIRDKVETVDFTLKKGTTENLKETYLLSNVEDKDLQLYYLLLNHPGRNLVFVNSIDNVMNLVTILQLLQLPVIPLHSSLQQRQRLKHLDRFKDKETCTMVCTDVAARGLDICNVDTVIHYQLPSSKEAYIHRSGRTARASNSGLSIAMVGPKDFNSYKKISGQMTEFPMDVSRLRVLREPLKIAREIFKHDRLKSRPLKKAQKLMALAKAAGLDAEDDAEEIELNPQRIKSLKRRLNQLLEQPVINPLSSARYISAAGSIDTFQTINKFSIGRTALSHCSK